MLLRRRRGRWGARGRKSDLLCSFLLLLGGGGGSSGLESLCVGVLRRWVTDERFTGFSDSGPQGRHPLVRLFCLGIGPLALLSLTLY